MKKIFLVLIAIAMLCLSSSVLATGNNPQCEAVEPLILGESVLQNIDNLNDDTDTKPSIYSTLIPKCEPVTPIFSGDGTEFVNYSELHEDFTRGSSSPTETTSLPYTAEATISNSVYTDRMFMPNSSGEFFTKLTGKTINGSGTIEVTLTLYDHITGKKATSYTYGPGTTFSDTTRWYNLDPSHYYYYRITKTNILGPHLQFTLQIKGSNSF